AAGRESHVPPRERRMRGAAPSDDPARGTVSCPHLPRVVHSYPERPPTCRSSAHRSPMALPVPGLHGAHLRSELVARFGPTRVANAVRGGELQALWRGVLVEPAR